MIVRQQKSEGNMGLKTKKSILIIGAGRLGKGFIGEVFNKANWQVTFVDKNEEVIRELQKGSYTVTITGEQEMYSRMVSDYQAIHKIRSKDFETAFSKCDLVMIPVYPEDLTTVFEELIPNIQKMYEENPVKKIDLVLLTNQINLVNDMYDFLKANVDKAFYSWIENHLYIRDAIIRRSTDAASNAALTVKSLAIASLLIEKPLHISIDEVDWMEPAENVQELKKLKIYFMNGPHAATAFFGKYKGYTDILDAQKDPEIAAFVKEVAAEIYSACEMEFDLTNEQIDALVKLPEENQDMHDSISRIAYDPIRKLAQNDRLSGPIQIAEKNKVRHSNLDKAVAYGFKYFDKEDSNSVKLQQQIKKEGIFSTVKDVTNLEDYFVEKIVNEFNHL